MVLRIRVLPMISLLVFFAISCASSPKRRKTILPWNFNEGDRILQADKIDEREDSDHPPWVQRDAQRDYKIGPEDLLEISVFEEDKLNKTVRVSSQGNISLPLLEC